MRVKPRIAHFTSGACVALKGLQICMRHRRVGAAAMDELLRDDDYHNDFDALRLTSLNPPRLESVMQDQLHETKDAHNSMMRPSNGTTATTSFASGIYWGVDPTTCHQTASRDTGTTGSHHETGTMQRSNYHSSSNIAASIDNGTHVSQGSSSYRTTRRNPDQSMTRNMPQQQQYDAYVSAAALASSIHNTVPPGSSPQPQQQQEDGGNDIMASTIGTTKSSHVTTTSVPHSSLLNNSLHSVNGIPGMSIPTPHQQGPLYVAAGIETSYNTADVPPLSTCLPPTLVTKPVVVQSQFWLPSSQACPTSSSPVMPASSSAYRPQAVPRETVRQFARNYWGMSSSHPVPLLSASAAPPLLLQQPQQQYPAFVTMKKQIMVPIQAADGVLQSCPARIEPVRGVQCRSASVSHQQRRLQIPTSRLVPGPLQRHDPHLPATPDPLHLPKRQEDSRQALLASTPLPHQGAAPPARGTR